MDGGAGGCHAGRMRIPRLIPALAVAVALVGLTACAQSEPAPSPTPTATSSPTPDPTPPTPVIAPVTMDVGDLQGQTVDLVVGQVLNIDTGDLDVTSYSGQVDDPAVAEFVAGREDGSATFNPGVTALAPGSTTVVLSSSQGGIQDVTFTVSVSD